MTDGFEFCDALGPTKIIHIYEPEIKLRGILVVDNTAAGPAIGGLRMATDVSVTECFRLARAMTLKNAAAGLPHGGGKSVLYGNPKIPIEEKEHLIRAFSQALRGNRDYIFGPDMGTNEVCMAWIRDEIGASVGLPREIGGIPLDEIGATGWGLYHAARIAVDHFDFDLQGARVVVQGFGAVGKHAARFLTDAGAILVAASDSQGMISKPQGLSFHELAAHKEGGHSVRTFTDGQADAADKIIDIECDIWIPAARPDVINEHNVDRLNTKIMIQGANIPCTASAEERLHERGILVIPDFIANAGGVICAAMEYQGSTQSTALRAIEEKITHNVEEVLALAQQQNLRPRQAATQMAEKRVRNAMTYRRFSSFSNAPNFL
ncbi:MAG: Glu/Leu/Phe/Val dehydrogenase [Pseudomonadales bacterium]|nr:Glu/Leu/Phe/Val dehydrogenase [Pseudomonadales bacterium]